ncbi:MAG TPA: hypothetical protein VJ963_13350, partial [Bacteroidales bacterium]|nr:hypothetical protein [Bacteroidales bacterium]
MSSSIKLKRGLDIKIGGKAEKVLVPGYHSSLYGVRPVDFPGLTPKLDVKTGDSVKAGTPLFHDKKRPEIKFVSPVSGKVAGVIRGDRRKLLEVTVEKEGDEFVSFEK